MLYQSSTGTGSGLSRHGLISPLSGAWKIYGRAHSAGFLLAVAEINAAGGVLGRKIEVVIGDSKSEPRIVVEQANRLIREGRVDFLAGTMEYRWPTLLHILREMMRPGVRSNSKSKRARAGIAGRADQSVVPDFMSAAA
ncbi:MAG TPA: ABC transporter substrate-binding protein [Acidobacteriaceae bacterium]|jgi:hypothetical protein|nr:ABC transporter substrate-binding protein [Acidobacteriaceae bacterium]